MDLRLKSLSIKVFEFEFSDQQMFCSNVFLNNDVC